MEVVGIVASVSAVRGVVLDAKLHELHELSVELIRSILLALDSNEDHQAH